MGFLNYKSDDLLNSVVFVVDVIVIIIVAVVIVVITIFVLTTYLLSLTIELWSIIAHGYY